MTCYYPLEGFKKPGGGITWSPPSGYVDVKVVVPCGQCVGCRLERSRQWAVRIMHEAQLHEDNCFVTSTYDDEHLPADGSLNRRHFQLFMKRLRKRFRGVSYFHCGEYGDENGRPHYHAILMGCDFRDRVLWCTGPSGDPSYTSESLSVLWPYGLATVGDCSQKSAAYCARYCLKKVNGDLAVEHYKRFDANGVAYWLEPEYATMSTRPAIGKRWFEKFGSDVTGLDGVVVDGRVQRPPRYYDILRRRQDEMRMRRVKRKRVLRAMAHAKDQMPERLRDREVVKLAQLGVLKRSV